MVDKIATGVYHWRDGVHFGRDADGTVSIFKFDPNAQPGSRGTLFEMLIPPSDWASIVASVSRQGDTGPAYGIAKALHDAPEITQS